MKKIKKIWADWETGELIGEGAFSRVYRIKRRIGNTTDECALKIISVPRSQSDIKELSFDGFADDNIMDFLSSVVESFTEEIEAMIKFRGCANVVNIQDYAIIEKDDGIGWDIYIRMELLTPFNAFAAKRKFTESEIVEAGIGLCGALSAFQHSNPPLIHRDIKPSNIFVSDYGVLKIGDFGTVREIEKTYGSYTRTGTLDYTAPEAWSKGEYSARSDIYSVGLILYKLANDNRLPFSHEGIINVKEKSRNIDRRFSGEDFPLPSNVSKALGEVILKACSYKVKNRYGSADEFAEALRNAVSVKGKKHKNLLKPVLAGGALIVAAVLFWLFPKNERDIPVIGTTEATTTLSSASEFYPPSSTPPDITPPKTTAAKTTSATTTVTATTTPFQAVTTTPETEKTTTAHITTAATTIPSVTTTAATYEEITTEKTDRTVRKTKEKTTSETTAEPKEKDVSEKYFVFSEYGRGVSVDGYTGDSVNVTIPDEIDGKPVVAIGEEAFKDDDRIKSIVLPKSVREINAGAFYNCRKLESVTIAEGTETIQPNAFYGCSLLKSIDIPSTVSFIGDLNFGWGGYEAINVHPDNRYYASVDGVLYNKDITTLIFYPLNKKDEEYTIPKTVRTIGFYAIDRPVYLKKLILPANLKSFDLNQITGSVEKFGGGGKYFKTIDGVLFTADGKILVKFPGSRRGESYVIPDGTEYIENRAFCEPYYLREIYVPKSVIDFSDSCIYNPLAEIQIKFK